MARPLFARGHAQYRARVRLPGRQPDRRHPRPRRAYRAALAALAGGHGQGVFAHKSRRDPAIAATGSRAYCPGMTAPHQEASKLGQFSWALFDWANQPFFTVVTTFIFVPYFANVMVGNAVEGQAAWAFTQSTSGILIALMSPFLGAMADAGGCRKPYIFAVQLLLGLGCAALWWAYPGRPDLIGPISAAVVIATVGAEMSIVFNNAQLPHIVRPERMGWLSGFGWGLGYCGGLVSLGIVLAFHFSLGPDPTYVLERLTGPASSLWLAVFVLPMFLFTPDHAGVRRMPMLEAARHGGRSLLSTVKKLRHFRNALTYLIAFMLYNDGLAAIIAFGGVYASATFGWDTTTLGIFGTILTPFATPRAFPPRP